MACAMRPLIFLAAFRVLEAGALPRRRQPGSSGRASRLPSRHAAGPPGAGGDLVTQRASHWLHELHDSKRQAATLHTSSGPCKEVQTPAPAACLQSAVPHALSVVVLGVSCNLDTHCAKFEVSHRPCAPCTVVPVRCVGTRCSSQQGHWNHEALMCKPLMRDTAHC